MVHVSARGFKFLESGGFRRRHSPASRDSGVLGGPPRRGRTVTEAKVVVIFMGFTGQDGRVRVPGIFGRKITRQGRDNTATHRTRAAPPPRRTNSRAIRLLLRLGRRVPKPARLHHLLTSSLPLGERGGEEVRPGGLFFYNRREERQLALPPLGEIKGGRSPRVMPSPGLHLPGDHLVDHPGD